MRKEEAIRGFGWNALFTLINRIGLPLVNIVLAALIGPAGFGDYAALNSTYVIIELFREAGLGITFIADKEIPPERERTYNFISVLNGLLFASVLFAGRNFIAEKFNQPELAVALAVLCVGMVVASMGTVPALKLTRAARFRDVGLIDTATNFVSAIVAVVAYKLGAGFMSLVYSMVSRTFLFCILSNIVSPAAWGKPSWYHTREIMSKAIANMSSNIAYTVYTMGDYVFVRSVLGPAANGLYTFAFNIANKPVEIVTGPLRQTMFVALTRNQDDPDRLSRNFGRAFGAALLLSIPTYALLFFHAPAIVHVLPGTGFDNSVPILRILCAYLFMRSIATIASVALVAAGKERWTVYGWIPAYLVLFGYMASHWPLVPGGYVASLDPKALATPEIEAALKTVVTGLMLGAVTCYTTYLIVAFRFAKPPAEVRARIARFGATGIFVGLLMFAATLLPVHEYLALGIAMVVGFFAQTGLVSKQLLGRMTAGFSKSGLKSLVGEL